MAEFELQQNNFLDTASEQNIKEIKAVDSNQKVSMWAYISATKKLFFGDDSKK